MTEIPEHLLKRSRERREALGLSTGDEGAATPPPSAPAAAATPLDRGRAGCGRRRRRPLRHRQPRPSSRRPRSRRPPYVEAACAASGSRSGRCPVVALLPFWAFIYVSGRSRRSRRRSPARSPAARRSTPPTARPATSRRAPVTRRWHRLPAQRRRGAPDLPRHRRPGRLREVGLASRTSASPTATRDRPGGQQRRQRRACPAWGEILTDSKRSSTSSATSA